MVFFQDSETKERYLGVDYFKKYVHVRIQRGGGHKIRTTPEKSQ